MVSSSSARSPLEIAPRRLSPPLAPTPTSDGTLALLSPSALPGLSESDFDGHVHVHRQLGSRESSSGAMNKNAFVEITKLYFYEEVVDLLPIKMVR
jgi:hypothetical protein